MKTPFMKQLKIKVVGIGGCGYSIVEYLVKSGFYGVNFDCFKKDKEDMKEKIWIESILKEVDVLFLITGMGGATGTSMTPTIAKLARERGIYTSAIVTMPMEMEGKERKEIAEKGILELRNHVNSLIELPNTFNFSYKVIKDIPINDLFYVINHMASGVIRSLVVPIKALYNTNHHWKLFSKVWAKMS